jgi:hypothetical protein
MLEYIKMVRRCNPKSRHAKNREYICNPKSGRWVRKDGPTGMKIYKPKRVSKRTDRTKYQKPVRNYRCINTKKRKDEKILNDCMRSVDDISLGKVLGQGSFGKVYSGTGIYRNNKVNVAIKVIKNVDLDDIFEEVELSYYMSEVGLGPKVYDAFFIKRGGTYTQYLIMEPFDGDVFNALQSTVITKKSKEKIILEMTKILRKQLFTYNMLCYDLKPENYVYKKDGTVRMIDFGADFCNIDNEITYKEKEIIFIILLVQIASLVNEMNTEVDVEKTLDTITVFRNRMNYFDEIFEELRFNDTLTRTFKHYTLPKGRKYNKSFIKMKIDYL